MNYMMLYPRIQYSSKPQLRESQILQVYSITVRSTCSAHLLVTVPIHSRDTTLHSFIQPSINKVNQQYECYVSSSFFLLHQLNAGTILTNQLPSIWHHPHEIDNLMKNHPQNPLFSIFFFLVSL